MHRILLKIKRFCAAAAKDGGAFLRALMRTLCEFLDDIAFFAGVLCCSYSARLIYQPAGWGVLGLGLIFFALLVARGRR